MEKESRAVLGKNKHYLGRENKSSKKQGIIVLWDVEIYANTYAYKELKSMQKDVKLKNQLSFNTLRPR